MLRFTIRDVLWAIALAAAVAAWWAEHRKYNAMAIAANNQGRSEEEVCALLKTEYVGWEILTGKGDKPNIER